jgi:hypothetical protein
MADTSWWGETTVFKHLWDAKATCT